MPIDDIGLVQYIPWHVQLKVPEEGPNVTRTVKKNPVKNSEVVVTIIRNPGVVTIVDPVSRLVQVKLSVPRFKGSGYNFPLAQIEGVADLPIEMIERFVSEATGWTSIPALEGWPVRQVGFAIDINVGADNMRPTLHALSAIRRAYASGSQVWKDRSARLTGVTYGGERYRPVFYDKEAEMLNRVRQLRRRQEPFPRGKLDERRAQAAQAQGVIRFEVNLRGPEEVRAIYDLPTGHQPTLRLVARPGVGEYVLASELRRMRLDLLDHPIEDQHEEHGLRDLGFEVLRRAQAFNKAEGPKDSKRETINLVRAIGLFGYYVLLSEADRKEVVAAWNGGGESSLFDLERDLRAVGMPNIGHISREPLCRLERFIEFVRRELPVFPERPPQMPEEPYASSWIADAPWAAHADDFPDIPGVGIDDLNNPDDDYASAVEDEPECTAV